MRKNAIRTFQLIGALILVAAGGFAGQEANAQAAYTPPAVVPAAPAGGIDPSKMPDIEGVHLGMTIPQALAILNPLYPPKGGMGITGSYGKFLGTTDPAWQAGITGVANPCLLANQGGCSDDINLIFSIPPSKQVAISIDRAVSFQSDKYPTEANVKAALIQKYGPNPILIGPDWLGWIFDEQGKPVAMTGTAATNKMQCGGNILAVQGSSPSAASAASGPSVTAGLPLSQAQVDQWMRDVCRSGVVVWAKINASGPYATVMEVKMSANGEATRDYIVMQEYLDKLGAAQKLQQQKKAQQVAAPKL